MSDLFNFNVRVVMLDNEPWWVAKDVCDVLGTKTFDLRKILDPDEIEEMVNINIDSIHIYNKAKGNQGVVEAGGYKSSWWRGKSPLLVSESGLYSLMLRSRKPIAKKFKRWITHEVIPAIRKHGAYNLKPLSLRETGELYLKLAESEEKRLIADKRVVEQQNTLVKQKQVILESKRFIDFSMRIEEQEEDMSLATAAKLLGFKGIGRNNLVRELRELGIFLRYEAQPYQRYVNAGYFILRNKTIITKTRKEKNVTTTKVTGKGLAYIHKKLGEHLGVF